MIQFGQNHTVNPQGNEAKNMPRLTAEKEALLLVTPTLEMGDIDKLVAEIYKDGVLLRTVNLADPIRLKSQPLIRPILTNVLASLIVIVHGRLNSNGTR